MWKFLSKVKKTFHVKVTKKRRYKKLLYIFYNIPLVVKLVWRFLCGHKIIEQTTVLSLPIIIVTEETGFY